MTTTRRITIPSRSPRDTAAIAARFARNVAPGHVLALIGGLGAGKTVFAEAFARALGVRGPITSPTFLVVSAHPARVRSIRTLYHIDCYRLASVRGGDLDMLIETTADPHALCLIEWADRIGNLDALVQTKKLTTVRFRITGKRTRALSIEGSAGTTRALQGPPASPIRRGRARERRG